MIPRGSGDHHPSGPGPIGPRACNRMGNSPWRYAASSVPGREIGADPGDFGPFGHLRRCRQLPTAGGRLDGHRMHATEPPLTCDFAREHEAVACAACGALASVAGCRWSVNRVRARSFSGCSWRCAPASASRSLRSRTAQTTTNASDLRAQADALSSKYFAALERVSSLDDDITRSEQTVATICSRARKAARAAARARALVAYTSSGTQLATLVDGNDTLDDRASRAPHRPGERARPGRLREVAQGDACTAQQEQDLRDTRQAQADALDELKAQGAAIDAKLAQAETQEQAQAAAAQAQPPRRPRPPDHDDDDGRSARGGRADHHHDGPRAEHPPPPPDYSGDAGGQPAPRRPVPRAACASGRAAATTAS